MSSSRRTCAAALSSRGRVFLGSMESSALATFRPASSSAFRTLSSSVGAVYTSTPPPSVGASGAAALKATHRPLLGVAVARLEGDEADALELPGDASRLAK